ncbi:uncharacterized protein LAESUDRAFT_694303 [Laetiporus sulphureus 93-53]|uniref:F-box domain-containing protein n=1 Tax=Laetiporus sulphureus 93-53 TaxID=1314785 RepID=A0A165G538_9APHY|nr:uncharacterized protein LAESUDRAFT_694303 [Laetiporus sulphureus 93-53]KZT09842.1 hypothetical protein LAESUDRAFT_694303 [Laetiporus sulphureus 93-53]
MPSTDGLEERSRYIGRFQTRKCILPIEVLEELVAFRFATNHAFSSIANLSLVSRQFRQLVLKRFFAKFHAKSAAHWTRCCQIPGVFNWVRTLHCFSGTLSVQPSLLGCFKRLQIIELDFSSDGLATQSDRISFIFSHLTSNITELRLKCLPRIDHHLLALIASRFTALEMLDLTCADRLDEACCWLCYEESSSCSDHSPVPDCHSSVEDLSVAFATALKPLKRLEHLFIGIFLSDLDLLYEHLSHWHEFNVEFVGTYGPDSCPACLERHSSSVRQKELIASVSIARTLPFLKTISWNTFFAEDQPGDDAGARVTTLWIRRIDGFIQARRAPW